MNYDLKQDHQLAKAILFMMGQYYYLEITRYRNRRAWKSVEMGN